MAQAVSRGLTEEGHAVEIARTGPDAVTAAAAGEFDLIVLDVMLPGFDGFEVARRLRRKHDSTPILMLTARDTAPDIVGGLDSGADDYLTKPFAFDVLLARVRAIGRRTRERYAAVLCVADLTLDPARHRVTRGGRELTLTRTEYLLLEFLMRRTGRVVSRTALIEAVWGYERPVENNTLDVYVSLLRQKIDAGHALPLIRTIRGVGYSIDAEGGGSTAL